MATTEWSAGFETTPAGNTSRRLGDDRIRELKQSIRERLQKGGHYMQDSVAPFNKDGRHVIGVGDGPDIYKSDATTKLVTYADTVMTLATGMDLVVTDGIKQSTLRANVATSTNHASSSAGTTVTAGGGTYDIATGVLTLGTPKGVVLVLASFQVEALTAANKKTAVSLAFDYTNGGSWTSAAGFQPATFLYVPLRTAANESNLTIGVHTIDPMTTSSDGGSYKVRARVTNEDAANDIIVRAYWIDIIELRR